MIAASRSIVVALAPLVAVSFVGCGSATTTGAEPSEPPPRSPPAPSEASAPSAAVDAGAPSGDAAPDGAVSSDAGCAKPVLQARRSCSDVWLLPCGVPTPSDGGTFSAEECRSLCGEAPSGLYYRTCGAYLLDDLAGPALECTHCLP